MNHVKLSKNETLPGYSQEIFGADVITVIIKMFKMNNLVDPDCKEEKFSASRIKN